MLRLLIYYLKTFERAGYSYLLAFFLLLPKFFFQKKCIFLCQNFGISKNYIIFVIQKQNY